jgi:hypothetical protein
MTNYPECPKDYSPCPPTEDCPIPPTTTEKPTTRYWPPYTTSTRSPTTPEPPCKPTEDCPREFLNLFNNS